MRSTGLSSVSSGIRSLQAAELTTRLQQCSISTFASTSQIASSSRPSTSLIPRRHAMFGSSGRPQPKYRLYDDAGVPVGGRDGGVDASDVLQDNQRSSKPFKAGSFKDAFYNDPADVLPDEEYLSERLRLAVYPFESSSRANKSPDPYKILDASTPLLKTVRHTALLDPFVLDIPPILANHFVRARSGKIELPMTQKAVGDVLAACFHRAARRPFSKRNQSFHDKELQEKVDAVADAYAVYLLDQSFTTQADSARLPALLETLQQALRSYQVSGSGYRIPVSLVAAWVVLRAKTEDTSIPPVFIWPQADLVSTYLQNFMVERGIEGHHFSAAIKRLYEAKKLPELPASPEQLEKKLRNLVSDGHEGKIIDLWRQFRDHMGTETPDGPPTPLLAPEIRQKVLWCFLFAVKATRFGDEPPRLVETLEKAAEEIVSFVPRPLSREILHVLMANRARVVGGAPPAESGTETYALDRFLEEEPAMSKKEVALQNLHEVWKLAHARGAVRDVKLYMLYMEGLGRLGDLEALQRVWNELIEDKVCRETWEKDGDLDSEKVFPPVRALNQMIQSTILIPIHGPPVALDLFKQATQSNSAIPANIITFNTVLRYYARKQGLTEMQELFALAHQLNLRPDLVTYSTLIQGLLRVGHIDMAKQTLTNMYDSGFPPNEHVCTLLIHDLVKDGTRVGLRHAEEMLREMKRNNLDIGVVCWTALVSGYFRGGWIEDGWDAVRRMEASQLQLNRVAYNVILRQAGDKIEIDSRGIPSTIALFYKMVQDGIRPNSNTYIILLKPLMEAKLWAEADKVVKMMEQLKFVPEKKALRELLKKVKFRRNLDWESPTQRGKRLARQQAEATQRRR